jgi:hypothetical protein
MSVSAAPSLKETFRLRDLPPIVNRSIASIHRDLALGRFPAGFRIGRTRLWLCEEIRAWLAAGAPPRAEWEATQKGDGRRSHRRPPARILTTRSLD